MEKRNINTLFKALFALGFIAFLFAGITVCLLFDIPFGSLFTTSFYFCLGGFLVAMFALNILLFFSAPKWKKVIGLILIIPSFLFLIISIIILIDFRIFLFQGLPPKPTKAQWQEDLKYLAAEMPEKHPDLFSLVNKEKFYKTVEILNEQIPALDDNKIKAELMKILALPNDAHSYPNIFALTLDLHVYPLKTYYFDDGFYITDAGRGYEKSIGSRLLKIGDTDVFEVYEKLKFYLSAENEFGLKERAPILMAEWLLAEGIIPEMDDVNFTFQSAEGESFSFTMEPVHYLPYFYWAMAKTVEKEISPAITNDRKNNYWFEYREDTGTFYFQFNRTIEQDDKPLDKFIDQLREAVNSHEFDRFIIDLRLNDGGNLDPIFPIYNFISENKKINVKEKLFVIIGRKTFSGGVVAASMLQQGTKAIFVGEPTGQGPNYFAVPQPFILPNSKLNFLVSTRLTQSSVEQNQQSWIAPDIQAGYTFRDFIEKRDPSIEAIFNYQPFHADGIKLNEKTLNKYTGRYLYSPYQILTIEKQNDKLSFNISDFIENSPIKINSDLYPVSETRFLTDIPFVELNFSLNKNNSITNLHINWDEEEKIIYPIPRDYVLPMEYIRQDRIDEGIQALLENKDDNIKYIRNLENLLNSLGYDYLRKNEIMKAIKIFYLNVELFPKSSNTYDSLGEGYMKNNESELAVLNYKKSLELNPGNTNAKNMLKKLSEQ